MILARMAAGYPFSFLEEKIERTAGKAPNKKAQHYCRALSFIFESY